jgi:hypothetical protein
VLTVLADKKHGKAARNPEIRMPESCLSSMLGYAGLLSFGVVGRQAATGSGPVELNIGNQSGADIGCPDPNVGSWPKAEVAGEQVCAYLRRPSHQFGSVKLSACIG